MKLFLDVSRFSFQVSRGVMEKVDENGRQKTNRLTHDPLWTVQVTALALDGSGAEVLNVTVAGIPPKLTVGQAVNPVELEAIPWAQGQRNGVAYRAAALNLVSAAKSSTA